MKGAALSLLAVLTLAATLSHSATAQDKPAQFVYVLRVAPNFQSPLDWTAKENDVIARHFDRLAKATAARQVILAGRTTEALDRTFGIVIFEASDLAAARMFMQADPAVLAGLMTATLHPYDVALQRGLRVE